MRLKALLAAGLAAATLLTAGCAASKSEHTHEFQAQRQELTCTQDAGVRQTCACGYSYVDVETKATGHAYETTQVEATDQLPGYTQYTCTVCGDTYQTDFTGGSDASTEPEVTEPQETVPSTEPEETTPDTEPEETAPSTEPKETTPATEPEETEPEQTEPEETEPATQPPVHTNEGMSFFNDAAFIGDSVSLKLKNYHAANGTFGSAVFLTAGSYSVNHAVNDTMFLTYQGQQMTPEDALAACGAKKVFILLGMNDIGLVGVDGSIDNWATFISRIRAKNPDIAIYIQSGTPIYASGERGSLTNANMNAYNQKLQSFAAANGCYYIDIATTMKDASGGLKAAYCSDEYVHLTDAGCEAWIAVLKAYVGAQ